MLRACRRPGERSASTSPTGGASRSYPRRVLARGHSWFAQNTVVADTAVAIGVLALTLPTLFDGEARATAGEVVATVLLVAPLAARRTAPVAMFAAVMLACGAELVLSDRFLAANVAALLALYTLVAYAPRRVAAAGVAVAMAGTIPFALHFDEFARRGPGRRRSGARGPPPPRCRARRLPAGRAARTRRRARAPGVAGHRARARADRPRAARHRRSRAGGRHHPGRWRPLRRAQRPAAAAAALETIAATAREALAETRRTVGTLGEAPREPVPGAGELRALVDRTRDAGLTVELDRAGPRARALAGREPDRLPRRARGADQRAQARRPRRQRHRLAALGGRRGDARRARRWWSPSSPSGDGRGLSGMRVRVEPYGGTVSAGPHPEGGYELRADDPGRRRTT